MIRDLPIRRKLIVISMATSGAALLLACGVSLTYERLAFRKETTTDLSFTAGIVGFNCAADLAFKDASAAERSLKGLDAQPHITAACIYNADGEFFAGYRRNAAPGAPGTAWPAARDNTEQYRPNSLELFRRIDNAGEKVGVIYLQSDLGELHDRMRRYALITCAVLLTAMLMSWLIAIKLQRVISEPLSHLASVAGRVAAEKDYSLRATKKGNDELGRLIDGFNEMLGQIQRRDSALQEARDGLEKRVEERTKALEIEVKEREVLSGQLLETSRRAGMAEVATGVLHNVGNVLNSVNVSATLVLDQVRHSKTGNVAKVCALLGEHEADLGAFLAEDAKGRMVLPYLATLAEALAAEQKAMGEELTNLQKNIDHIKDIVAMQQDYAKTSGVAETISLPDLIEDALRMNAGSLARHDVGILREYGARPVITVEKHKVLQILVNLLRNGKYACDESGRQDKLITVRTTADEHGVSIVVIDNGVGIPQENLTRIFAHGFTTRKHGHGFGLHSGALAAKEIGGILTGHSAGPGQGATFILELPYKSEAIHYEKPPS